MPSTKLTILGSGNVGIGITPSYQLELSTDSAAKPSSNAWTITSDERVKTNIRPFTDSLSVINGINPVWYQYNGKGGFVADGKDYIGVIAQDIMKAAPYTVSTYKAKLNPGDPSETELYNFNSHALTFVMINAIKEQQKEIEDLKLILNPDGTLQNASSTAEFAQQGGLFDWLVNSLKSLGIALHDGIASLKEVVASKFTGDEADIKNVKTEQIQTSQICVKDSGNNDICLTGDQLRELLNKAGASMTIITTYPVPPADPAEDNNQLPTIADNCWLAKILINRQKENATSTIEITDSKFNGLTINE